MTRPTEVNFTTDTKLRALARQDFLCGSCGSLIVAFNSKYKRRDGSTGTRWRFRSVAYEETAHGHHMQHANLHDRPGGPTAEELAHHSNCVMICSACHYSAHEGGRYATGTVLSTAKDYPYFKGTKGRRS